MLGITAYGAYIPWHRLSRADIAKMWEIPAPPGEKAVASYDEDTLTMAVAAARDCLKGIDPKSIGGVYFASTTSPYKEKQNAATMAAVMGTDVETFTLDFANSLRSGVSAMRVATDTVKGGAANNVMVCSADMRLGHLNGEMEMSLGDGAAAVTVGDTKVIAEIEGSYTFYDELIDIWRSDKDAFVRFWEDRFIREEGYGRVVPIAVSAALKKYNLTPKDFSKAIFDAPDARQLGAMAKTLGFDLKTQVQDPLYSVVGNTGTALSMMCLVAALEEAKPGDRILLTSYGSGCDIFILKVTDEIKKVTKRRGIRGHLGTKQMLSYGKYLKWRELVETEPAKRPPFEVPSAVALWRDTKRGLTLCGAKCKACGTPQYPAQRVCVICQAKDELEDYCFADKIGILSAFSHDALGLSVDPPVTTTAVDFPEGGRIMCDMTDRDLAQVKVGMPVEMTFRKLRYSGGIYDYWWKCQPVRGEI